MQNQKLCVKSSHHMSNMLSLLGSFQQKDMLVDVTISCQGKNIKAHKIILSACSPYFQNIFMENPCQHPIIIINGMKFEDINAILNFMYKGEVNVSQDELSSFLQAAEALKVKGLAETCGGKKSTNSVIQEVQQSEFSCPQRTDTPPRKRPRNRKRSLSDSNRSDDEGLSRKHRESSSSEAHELSDDESFTDDNNSNAPPSHSVTRVTQNPHFHKLSSNKGEEDDYDVSLNRMFEQRDVFMNNINTNDNLKTEHIRRNATEMKTSSISDPESHPDIKPIVNFEERRNLILCSEQSQPGPSNVQESPLSQLGSSHAQEFQDIVIQKLAKLEDSIKKMSQNISLLGTNINSVTAVPVALYDSVQPALPIALPMTTYEELQTIEDWLQDPDNIRILVTQLSSVGGSDARDTTRRVLSRVLKGEITWSINWTGKNGKIGFMKTALANIIISAVQISHPDATEKHIEENVKMWFRFAKDRDGGREKRRQEKSAVD